MENYEELLHKLDEFERSKPKEIPRELDDYLAIVAKNGDPVYPWIKVRNVYRAKIINVLNQFYESSSAQDDPTQFSYDGMKGKILDRFDSFRSAPFTIQRLSELLISPRKEYNRMDKYMRALEKNILVVSIVEPGCSKHVHLNGSVDSIEEGFQVSSASVYEDYRQRVAGLMEHEVAAASITDERQNEMLKNERCKRSDEDMREEGGGDMGKSGNESHHMTGPDGDATVEARLNTNQRMLDHQEFHRLEFSLAESDTLAIVEIVSEVDCPSAEISEDSSKDYPLSHSMMDSSSEVQETIGPVMPDVESCDTVTEIVATDTSVSVSINEELGSTERGSLLEKDADDSVCSDDSPPKGVTPLCTVENDTRMDCQKVDFIDIGGGDDCKTKGEKDGVVMSDSTKVLVLSSPGVSPKHIDESPMHNVEESGNSREESDYLPKSKNASDTEETCEVVESHTNEATGEHKPEAVLLEESPKGSCESEVEETEEQESPNKNAEPMVYKEESFESKKETNS